METKVYMNKDKITKSWLNAALLLRSIFCIVQLKTRWLPEFKQVMGPEQQKFFFVGDEPKYEL